MSFAKFCSLLENKALFFALVSDMTNTHDGFICYPPPRRPGDRLQSAEHMGYEVLHKMTQNSLINCWTESGHESSLMWNSYAGAEGVAISTTLKDLQVSILSIDPELPVTFGKVVYVDYSKQEVPRFRQAPLFHKRMEYLGEDEVRIALPCPEWDIRHDPDKANKPIVDISLDPDVAEHRGRYIPIDLKNLVKKVILPPHSTPWFGQLVQSVVDSSPIEVQVTPSSLQSSPDNATT